MAHRVYTQEGRPIWRPDTITVGTFRLDPDAMERDGPMSELWRLIRTQVSVWLSKFGVYASTPEPIEDLESGFGLAIFEKLRAKVLDGSYRRDLSLYLNCRGVAWSLCTNFLYRFMRDKNWYGRMLRMDQTMSGLPEKCTLGEMITYGDTKKYVNRIEYAKARNDRTRRKKKPKGRNTNREYWKTVHMEEAWFDYLGDCEEYGITPLDLESFLALNSRDDGPSENPPSASTGSRNGCGSKGSSRSPR